MRLVLLVVRILVSVGGRVIVWKVAVGGGVRPYLGSEAADLGGPVDRPGGGHVGEPVMGAAGRMGKVGIVEGLVDGMVGHRGVGHGRQAVDFGVAGGVRGGGRMVVGGGGVRGPVLPELHQLTPRV